MLSARSHTIGIGIALLVTTAGCSSSGAGTHAAGGGGTGPRVVEVVAGENVWGDLVRQVGGAHVRVTSIIDDPNTDPHEYEADARDAAAASRASLVVTNGAGYDGFMTALLAASPHPGRTMLSVQQVLGVTGHDPNPHLWYDIAALPHVAAAVAGALGRLDPADAPTFAANARAFGASLHPILAVIARIRAEYAGTEIAYTERVPGYLVEAAGLVLGVPSGFTRAVEDGTDPSPADTAAFDRAVRTRSVKVLLYNGQVTDPQTTRIKALATRSGVPVVGVTETLPESDPNLQAWQLRQARELLTALGG